MKNIIDGRNIINKINKTLAETKTYKARKNSISRFLIENNILFHILPIVKNGNKLYKQKSDFYFSIDGLVFRIYVQNANEYPVNYIDEAFELNMDVLLNYYCIKSHPLSIFIEN